MSELLLTGLDGRNPLAFLAALGVLEIVANETDCLARLAWRTDGAYAPVLSAAPDREALLELLVRDATSFRGEPAIEGLKYAKGGDGPEAHDLKPPKGRYARYLRGLPPNFDGLSPRSLAFACAFATDVTLDNNGNTKPTALHFTAGQQEFLRMVVELRDGVNRNDFEEALFGPWRYARPLPVLQWDNTSGRDYALRAGDPAKEKKLGVPGADWLAFRALPFLRVAPVGTGTSIQTTGCTGSWKVGAFRWPIWTVPLSCRVIASLLTSPELLAVDPSVLRERGIATVLESSILRSEQGGYGSFTPARVARRT